MSDVDTIELVRKFCLTCGVVYALPAYIDEQRKVDYGTMCCPNGHGQSYIDPDREANRSAQKRYEAERERRAVLAAELEQAKAEIERIKGTRRWRRRQRREATLVIKDNP